MAKEPSVKLISNTWIPIETLFAVWAQSRPTQYPELFKWLAGSRTETYQPSPSPELIGSVLTAVSVSEARAARVITQEEIYSAFKTIAAMDLPITESIHFTWGFSDLPIEWREQAVRKRQWGFWLTSMREFTMEDFYTDGHYADPPEGTVSEESLKFFHGTLESIQTAYRHLQDHYGWSPEKARKVIPLCATHNGTMFSNLRTLLNTVSSRTCWIAQIDLWGPFVLSMVKSLGEIDPMLGNIISPPCFKRFEEDFLGCKYEGINENRCSGKDMYAPCPLYVAQIEGATRAESQYSVFTTNWGTEDKFVKDALRLIPTWESIWNRDPFTGKLKTK